ncbi:cytoskeleton-associated protein 2-like [Notothenia coriiceps]|uniref:Cytoskeleton-associated protein 2-like n=1 Tax=Notothenia coriiceps TaxID=8208 RepID=A0A6I9NXB2_9TELE|nr:PREDICTED: cytoskeleton-associated protein 2-like [Notothenia coriiceps]
MEEGETVSIPSRKELRKQKLMEYLAGKGKLKPPNPKPYLRDDCQVKNPIMSTQVVNGKENKAPADRLRYESTKSQNTQSAKHPAKGAFGIANKVNVKGKILTVRQNTNRPSATSGVAQAKLKQNPVLTTTYNAVSSKSNLIAASHLKKQPNTRKPPSAKNSVSTAVTKSNSKFGGSSNATWSCQMKTNSVRMSLGPMVKTKTGLIPTVIQPRNSQNLTHTSSTAAHTNTATTASVANKVRSSTSSSVSVSQRSDLAERRTLPTTALNNTERTRAGFRIQNQNMTNSKPLLGKPPSYKTQLSCGLKSVSTSSKYAAIRPEGRVGMSKSVKSSGQPTVTSTKQTGQRKGQQCKVVPPTVIGVTRAAVAELAVKSKTCKKTDDKKGHISANAPPPQAGFKRTSAPVVSQTVPRAGRTISHTNQATLTKTPKFPVRVIPQTEGKKLTAAQEERMKKLQEWREAKGISYKRPPMPVKPAVRLTVAMHQPFWGPMIEEDEVHSLISAVDRSLADCIILLAKGCPPEQVKGVLSRLPAVSKKFAKYWICQARLMEQEGNMEVLPMFEEAVGVVLEPVDELRTVVFEILKRKEEIQGSWQMSLMDVNYAFFENSTDNFSEDSGDFGDEPCGRALSSNLSKIFLPTIDGIIFVLGVIGNELVDYVVIFLSGPPSQQKEPVRVNGQEVRFFTPVRRSVRIERSSLRYPASLQEHDLCVSSYADLISEEDADRSEEQEGGETSPSAVNTPMYVYRQNEALEDKVFVKLVYDEDV